MNRTVVDHIVEGDSAPQLEILVVDKPGPGGANHEYTIRINGSMSEPPLGESQGIIEIDPDGYVSYDACRVHFQNGPIKEAGVNGVTQEALLAIVIDRLRCFQGGPFACKENGEALAYCHAALHQLQKRTLARIARGVEGTNKA